MNPLLVFVGGGMGAVLRYGVGRIAVVGGWGAPAATLAVNVVGCLAMGLLAGWFVRGGGGSEPWRLFLLTGVLGGFTTFSAFGLDALTLWQRGAVGLAAAYVAASVLLSLGAVALGFVVAR
uniref:fluoride efflux transporter CrcB n=1 Tax=Sphingomonas sp. TaxID=28214 RepID=UPI00286C425E|nr:fluoride efflux transporter CrcB [Sphingomonas sp.]